MVIFAHNPVMARIQSMLAILVLQALLLPVHAWAADCDRSQGAAAIPACRQALQTDPQAVDVLVAYADILLDLGRPDEAVDLLETSLGSNPTNSTARLKLSNAREAVAGLVEDTGPSSRAVEQLSVLRCKTRTGEAALDACSSALKNQPNDVDLLVAKGDALMLLNRPSEATQTYQLALAQDAANTVIQDKLETARAELTQVDNRIANAQSTLTDTPPGQGTIEESSLNEAKQIAQFNNASIDGRVSY